MLINKHGHGHLRSAAHKLWSDVAREAQHEHKKAARDHAGHGQREDDFAERRKFGAAKVARGLLKVMVDIFKNALN
ncbi:hypothetical protein SDC9_176286 [bioreactor metagenome]|uniref:Uncharacterized protein n=1 Tax=bioreactor metagenome TaxID=1076179 RepID=A0A645GPK6_9ZZZZ